MKRHAHAAPPGENLEHGQRHGFHAVENRGAESVGDFLVHELARRVDEDQARDALAVGSAGCILSNDVRADVGGKIAQLVACVIDGVAKKTVDRFSAKLAAAVQTGSAAVSGSACRASATSGHWQNVQRAADNGPSCSDVSFSALCFRLYRDNRHATGTAPLRIVTQGGHSLPRCTNETGDPQEAPSFSSKN